MKRMVGVSENLNGDIVILEVVENAYQIQKISSDGVIVYRGRSDQPLSEVINKFNIHTLHKYRIMLDDIKYMIELNSNS